MSFKWRAGHNQNQGESVFWRMGGRLIKLDHALHRRSERKGQVRKLGKQVRSRRGKSSSIKLKTAENFSPPDDESHFCCFHFCFFSSYKYLIVLLWNITLILIFYQAKVIEGHSRGGFFYGIESNQDAYGLISDFKTANMENEILNI